MGKEVEASQEFEHASQALARQSGFARQLARRLLWDAERGEDLVQDAWLAVLGRRRALPSKEPAAAASFWRGVLQFTARRAARSQARRATHERASFKPAISPAASDAAASLELTAKLVESVRSLPEAQSTVLVLRYFENLAPRQVAQRLQIPVDTVRTRERRGLAQLRQILDDKHGGRRAEFLSALIPLAGPPPWTMYVPAGRALDVALGSGSIAMQSATKVLCAVGAGAVALLAVGFLWRAAGPESNESKAPRVASSPDAMQAAQPQMAPSSPTPREVIAVQDQARSAAKAAAWSAKGRMVHGTQKAPFAGGKLSAEVFAGFDPREKALRTANLEAGEDGTFEWEIEPPQTDVTLVIRNRESGFTGAYVKSKIAQGALPPTALELHVMPFDAVLVGTVRDLEQRPIANAAISFRAHEALSGADGAFRMPVPRADFEAHNPAVTCVAKGFAVQVETATVSATDAEIQVSFTLRPELRIRGRVTDATGRAVSDALVRTFYAMRQSSRTDGEGRYALSNLDPALADHTLMVSKPGFVAQSVSLRARSTEVEQDVVLERGSLVEGRVVAPGGAGVAGAELYIGDGPNHWNRLDATSDDQGVFTFEGVAPGSVTLVAQAPKFAACRMTLAIPERGAPLSGVLVQLEAPLRASGVVRDSSSQPMAGVHVSVLQSGEYVDASAVSAADGRFVVEGLPHEHVELEFFGKDILRKNLKIDPKQATDLAVTLERSAGFAGHVVDSQTGAPIPNFRLRLTDPEGQPGDKQGTGYSASWQRLGVQCSHPGGEWSTGAIGTAAGSVLGIEIQAEGYAPGYVPRAVAQIDPDPKQLQVALVRGTTVRGWVVDRDSGLVVPGTIVRRVLARERITTQDPSDSHGAQLAYTGPDGAFELANVPPGKLRLHVSHPDYAARVDGPFEVAALPVERKITIDKGGRVVGRLLDAGDKPLADQIIILGQVMPGQAPEDSQTTTGADGSFAFEGVTAETVLVTHRMLVDNKPLTHLSLTIKRGGAASTELVLQAKGPCSVSGELIPQGGIELPSRTTVMFYPQEDSDVLPVRGCMAHTGRFQIADLPPGPYTVMASSFVPGKGMVSGSAQVELRAGPNPISLSIGAQQ